ncbi:MAG: hypothetical protein WC707_07060 [Candidatus Babeliaceae bacterium]|jgi:hypothetical protein
MNHFWYSEKQAKHFSSNNKMPLHLGTMPFFKRHYALINGIATLYTEMNATDKKQRLFYEDSVYLGAGIYSHSDGVW